MFASGGSGAAESAATRPAAHSASKTTALAAATFAGVGDMGHYIRGFCPGASLHVFPRTANSPGTHDTAASHADHRRHARGQVQTQVLAQSSRSQEAGLPRQ